MPHLHWRQGFQLPQWGRRLCRVIMGCLFLFHLWLTLHSISKLIEHISSVSKHPRSSISKAPTNMKEAKISSLSIRINEPYWLIHSGNCEHFIVFSQIRFNPCCRYFEFAEIGSRLVHPSDYRQNYPITTQISPILMDLCRACNKVPAIWSIVGDIRLGESPCVLCGPCWRQMGEGNHDTVLVTPLLPDKF